ncbi:MAG: aconitate hydratase [Verrucomicrobiota bacterium]
MAGKTVIEKIIASHLVDGELNRGEPVSISIDQTLCQDATGTMVFLELEAMEVERVKTELSVQYIDHNTSQFGPNNHNDHLYLQSAAAAKGAYFSRPGNGICHQVHLERFGEPGKTLLGSDSHTPTNGGLGMLAIGAGGLDVAIAMAGAPFTLTMPRIVGVNLSGELQPWVAAKDVILHLLSIMSTKGNVGKAVEYFGPGVRNLSIPERATITNMGAELGITSSIFPSDDITRDFLAAEKREDVWQELYADWNAEYDEVIDIDLGSLEPLAACPASPGNVRPVAELEDISVRQVVIGSCTNSSLQDMLMSATVLKDNKVADNVSLAIAPGSRQVLQQMARDGALADLIGAGTRVLETACGPCIGQGLSPASDEVTVRTFNRNFAGRTGTTNDQCYLTSPETAVATALTGKITDPRSLGLEYPKPSMEPEFLVDDSLIIPPPEDTSSVEIIRKPTIGEPPACPPFPKTLDGEVLISLGDKITTDHIMPAGAFLKYRSNIPEYSNFVFNCFNREGESTFADRAAEVRDAGKHGFIVAGESYGQGSSREHAAICPMHLGIRCVIAQSIERIHAANLINFGILPLIFKKKADYKKIAAGDSIILEEVGSQLTPGGVVELTQCKPDGKKNKIECCNSLSAEDINTVLAGGRLNVIRRQLQQVNED